MPSENDVKSFSVKVDLETEMHQKMNPPTVKVVPKQTSFTIDPSETFMPLTQDPQTKKGTGSL